MSDVEDKITLRNLQAEYDRITQELTRKASELSIIYKEIETRKSELAELENKKDVALTISNDALKKIDIELANCDNRKKEADSYVSIQRNICDDLVRKNKDAIKQLHKTNAQVLSASDEFDSYSSKINQLKQAEPLLLETVNLLEQTKESLRLLEIERSNVALDISTKIQECNAILQKKQEELDNLSVLCVQKQQEANEAQYKVKMYTDELYTHMNDYQILKTRLEVEWKKVYPELELAL